jgi:hypothetical protein
LPKGEEIMEKSIKNLVNEITTNNFSNLGEREGYPCAVGL